MTQRKICVVVTARPSYSRIYTALKAIQAHPELELQTVAAASAILERYGQVVNTIESDGIPVRAKVFMVLEGETLVTSVKTTGLGLIELSSVFDDLKPDVVVTIADRYETIATAIAASYMNIPLVHVQGGEVTGSIDDKVRHAVTKLADIHLVSTELARERVIRLGEDPERVFVTGCPSIDIAAKVVESPQMDFDPFQKYGGVGAPVDLRKGYLVVMQHPVTTEYEKARKQVTETLFAINELGLPTLWFWPNSDAGSDATSKGIRAFRENQMPEKIHFFKNIPPMDFLRLIHNARALVGNSSVAIRECAFLGVPAVNIGTREDGRERGPNVRDCSYDHTEILQTIRKQIEEPRPKGVPLYGDGHAGERIAKLLAEIPLSHVKRLTY